MIFFLYNHTFFQSFVSYMGPEKISENIQYNIFKKSTQVTTKQILVKQIHQEPISLSKQQEQKDKNRQNKIKKQSSKGKLAKEQQSYIFDLQKMKAQFYLGQIERYICDVVQRNLAYQCQFSMFLIPYALILKLIELRNREAPYETYDKKMIKFIIKRIKNECIRKQLRSQIEYYDISVILMKEDVNKQCLLKQLRKFLEAYQNQMISTIPYYYNFFALVINKQILFNHRKQQFLPYSVDLKHQQPIFNRKFNKQDINLLINTMQKLLYKKLHNEHNND